ncbi:MAG TPA: hypothetical protein VES60_17750, partial [Nakamurella sp.]|nr:hypothetical protein [Nakamurella sp.]
QLARQFAERPDVRYGITTMCVGLGMGGTVIWENPHYGSDSENDAAEVASRLTDSAADSAADNAADSAAADQIPHTTAGSSL